MSQNPVNSQQGCEISSNHNTDNFSLPAKLNQTAIEITNDMFGAKGRHQINYYINQSHAIFLWQRNEIKRQSDAHANQASFQNSMQKAENQRAVDRKKHRDKSDIERLNNIRLMSPEDIEPLLIGLLQMTGRFDILDKLDKNNYQSFFIEELENAPNPSDLFQQILNFKAHANVPESFIKWLKKDLRAALCFRGIDNEFGQYHEGFFLGKEEFVDSLYKAIYRNTTIFNKRLHEITARKSLTNFYVDGFTLWKKKYFNGRAKPRDVKWIRQEDSEQLDYLLEKFNENKILVVSDIFSSETNEEKHAHLLASLDLIAIFFNDSNNEVVKGVRNAWESQKTRNKKSSFEDTGMVKVYKKNRENLNLICSNLGKTPEKFINSVIEDMAKGIRADIE